MGRAMSARGALALGGFLMAGATMAVLSTTPAAAQGTREPTHSPFSGGIATLNTQPLGSLATGPGAGVDVSAAWAPTTSTTAGPPTCARVASGRTPTGA